MEQAALKVVRTACWASWGLVVALLVLNLDARFHDAELVRAMDMDEHSYATRLHRVLASGSLDPRGEFNYGFTYFAAAAALAKGLAALGLQVETFHAAGLILRLLSLAAFLGMLVLTFRTLARAKVSPGIALAMVAVLGASEDVLHHAVRVHPDSLQLMLIALGLALAPGEYARTRLWLAVGALGLAFGVKYTAAFALPGVVAYGAVLASWGGHARRGRRELLLLLGGAAGAFAVGWLVPNPYVLTHARALAADLAFESSRTSVRGVVRASDWLRWPEVLADQLSLPLTLIVVLGVAVIVHDAVRTRGDFRKLVAEDALRSYAPCLALFALAVFVYLVLKVRDRAPRYLWPMALPMLVAAGVGLDRVLQRARFVRYREWLATFVLVLATAHAARGASHVADGRLNLYASEDWALAEALPGAFGPACGQTRLAVDGRTYVPAGYAQKIFFPVTLGDLGYAPEGIVLSRATTGTLLWMEPGTKLTDRRLRDASTSRSGKRRAAASRELLHHLLSETSEYTLVFESESHLAFRRKDVEPVACERGTTEHRVKRKK